MTARLFLQIYCPGASTPSIGNGAFLSPRKFGRILENFANSDG